MDADLPLEASRAELRSLAERIHRDGGPLAVEHRAFTAIDVLSLFKVIDAAEAKIKQLESALREMLSWAIPGMDWTDETGQMLLTNARAALATSGHGSALAERVKRLEATLRAIRPEFAIHAADWPDDAASLLEQVDAALAEGEKP